MLPSAVIDTSAGLFLAVVSDKGLAALCTVTEEAPSAMREALGHSLRESVVEDAHPLLSRVERQLQAYLAGNRRGFSVPLDLRGTPFQRQVWDALQRIGYGDTRTYHQVAEAIRRPEANRAVAQACGQNPAIILVPCHRVVASGGGLGGFSSGLPLKRRLLSLEHGVAPHLPLFDVAERRQEEEDLAAARRRVYDALPGTLRIWLDAQDHSGPGLGPGRWLHEAMNAIEPEDLAILADLLAARTARSSDPMLASLSHDVLSMVADQLPTPLPAPEVLQSLLHAALLIESPSYPIIATRLLACPDLPLDLRTVLAHTFESIMEGKLSASTLHRQRTVDLWLDLHQQDGDDAWVAERSAEPSTVLAAAGMTHEAALAAERALAMGNGDRETLLLRLVDLYEQLGDFDRAAERLLTLLADEDVPSLHQRLRRLEDRRQRS